MAITGDQFTAYMNEAYIPSVFRSFFQNTWWLGPQDEMGQFPLSPFTVVQPGQCPGGPNVNGLIDYASTSNAEAYVRGAADPTPETLSSVRWYFEKDYFIGMGKVTGDVLSQMSDGFDPTVVAASPIGKAVDNSVRQVFAKSNAAILTSLATQVDATNAFGDGSISRATYGIASQETGVAGVLTTAVMQDLVEGAVNTTHGPVDAGDLVWLMPQNQITNLSLLTTVTTSSPLFADASAVTPIDGGTRFRTVAYEGVPIIAVPSMTNTEIYLMRRSTTKLYLHKALGTDAIVANDEWAEKFRSTLGVNLVVEDMQVCGKLTGVTA